MSTIIGLVSTFRLPLQLQGGLDTTSSLFSKKSNLSRFCTQFGLPHASSPLQRPIRHHSSTAYYTPPANPPHKSLP